MAGLDDLRAEANERWAKAERYAQGFADNGMGEALRVYYTRYFPAGVIVYVGALALVGSLLSGDEPTDWRRVLQAGSFLFALLAAIAGLIYNSKRIKPRAELGRNLSITVALDGDEQKYVKRVINGKEPPPKDPVRLRCRHWGGILGVSLKTANSYRQGMLVMLFGAALFRCDLG